MLEGLPPQPGDGRGTAGVAPGRIAQAAPAPLLISVEGAFPLPARLPRYGQPPSRHMACWHTNGESSPRYGI